MRGKNFSGRRSPWESIWRRGRKLESAVGEKMKRAAALYPWTEGRCKAKTTDLPSLLCARLYVILFHPCYKKKKKKIHQFLLLENLSPFTFNIYKIYIIYSCIKFSLYIFYIKNTITLINNITVSFNFLSNIIYSLSVQFQNKLNAN